MKVALTGARGYVGQFILDHILCRGDEVAATTTSFKRGEIFRQHKRLNWYGWRLNDPTCEFEFLRDANCLVHTAFDHVPGRYRGGEGDNPAAFIRNNLLGTLKLWYEAREYGVRRTVFISSRAVFGNVAPKEIEIPIHDEQRHFPDTLYGYVKASIEASMPEFADIGLCSLRPTGVYGVVDPIENSKWYNMTHKLDDSRESREESKQAKTEVHGVDVANAVSLMLTAPSDQVVGRAFNCSDVSISIHQLRYLIGQLRAGKTAETIPTNLPVAIQPHHQMSSDALIELGWKKGGLSRLIETIEQLIKS